MECHRDLSRFHADAEELDLGDFLGPCLHLCRTRAAPASPSIVKVNDCGLSSGREQFGRGGEVVVNLIGIGIGIGIGSVDQVHVKVADFFSHS